MEKTNPTQSPSSSPPAEGTTQQASPLEAIFKKLVPSTGHSPDEVQAFLKEEIGNLPPEAQSTLQKMEEAVAPQFPQVLQEPDVQRLIQAQKKDLESRK